MSNYTFKLVKNQANDEICMARNKEGIPEIGLLLLDQTDEEIAEFTCTLDQFIANTKEVYHCGGHTWAQELVDDLKLFKEKIQKQIDDTTAEFITPQKS